MSAGLEPTGQSMGRPTTEWVGSGPDPAPKIPSGGKAFRAGRHLHMDVCPQLYKPENSPKLPEVNLEVMW